MALSSIQALMPQEESKKVFNISVKNSALANWAKGLIHHKVIDLNSSLSEDNSQSDSSESVQAPTVINQYRLKTLKSKQTKCEKLQRFIKLIDTTLIFLSISSLILEIYNFENNFQDKRNDRYKDKRLNNIIKIFNFATTIFCIFLSYTRSVYSYMFSREKKIIFENPVNTYYNSSSFKVFTVDCLILILVAPPYLDFEIEFEQLGGKLYLNFDSICLSLMIFRFVLLLRLFLYYSRWSKLSVQQECRNHGVYRPLFFALKACLKDRPHYLLIPAFAISTLGLGVALQIYEKPFNQNNAEFADASSAQDFSFLYNSMWLILLSITTVGYGDTYPRTHMGRAIAIIAIIWGTFMISLMIIMFNNYILFSRTEQKSYHYLEKVLGNIKIKEFASKLLSRYIYLYIQRKKRKLSPTHPEMIKLHKEFLHFRCLFRQTVLAVRFKYPTFRDAFNSMNDELNLNLNKLQENLTRSEDINAQLDSILESQKKTIEYIKVCSRFSDDALQLLSYSRASIGL